MEKTKKQGHRIVLSDEEFKIIQQSREEEKRKVEQLKKEKEREDYILTQQFFKDAITLDEETKKVFCSEQTVSKLSHVDLVINKPSNKVPYDISYFDEQNALGTTIADHIGPWSDEHRMLSGPRNVYTLTLNRSTFIRLNVVQDKVVGISLDAYGMRGPNSISCSEFGQYTYFFDGIRYMKLHQNPLLNIIYCFSYGLLFKILNENHLAHFYYTKAFDACEKLMTSHTGVRPLTKSFINKIQSDKMLEEIN